MSESGAVVLVGEHDIAGAAELATALEAAAKLSLGALSVDLSQTTFIDSSVVAVLVECARALVRDGRGMTLRVTEGTTPAAVIEIVGLGVQPGIAIETVSARAAPG